MFSVIAGIAVTFLVWPRSLAETWPWIVRHVLGAYGPGNLAGALMAWKIILAVLIFAGTQALLRLVFALTGLMIARFFLSDRRRR